MKNELILAIIAGMFFGLAAILTKIALAPTQGFSISSLQHWNSFIFSWAFLGLVVFNILAVIFFWWSLRRGKAMIVAPVSSSFTILTSIIGAIVLFNEVISVVKMIAVVAIIIGTIILRK